MPDFNNIYDSLAHRKEPLEGFDDTLNKARTLMKGQRALKAAGTKYLPKYEAESDKAYQNRKTSSYLYGGYEKVLKDLTGRVFEKPTMVSEDSDPVFIEWAADIDLTGRDLSMFSKTLFEEGLASGIEYILVDAPELTNNETVARTARENLRPYLVHLSPENVLGWQAERLNNKYQITQFRFMQTVDKKLDEFKTESIEQIRVHDLNAEGSISNNCRVRVFEKDKFSVWQQVGEDAYTGLDEITITPFYANRKGFYTGISPMDSLANLNLAHWESTSDQRHIVHYARVPMLLAKALGPRSKAGDKPGAPKIAFKISQLVEGTKDSDLKFVEHSGKAIAAGRDDIKDLEEQMRSLGLQMLIPKAGQVTATGELRDERKEVSQLSMVADSLKDALEIAFQWMGNYQGIEFTGSIYVHNDFSAGNVSPELLKVFQSNVVAGLMTKTAFVHEMLRRGVYAEDFDVDAEILQLETELKEDDSYVDDEVDELDS